MKRIAHIIENIGDAISGHFAAWLTVGMLGLILAGVVARYFFDSPFQFAEEISAYMLAAMVFLGLGYTWKQQAHLKVTFLLDLLPKKVRKWLNLITLILAAIFVPVLIYALYGMVAGSLATGMKSYGVMRVPLAWPRLTLLIGSIILGLAVITDLIQTIRSRHQEKGRDF